MSTATAWPYPFWIAHRGAGKHAPENTLAAFRSGAAHGWRMFECDVKLSHDGVPYLMHDATLDRTTNGQGPAAELPWSALARLDAGAWHSRRWAGEPLPTLENLLRWCIANHLLLNIEIKPIPGAEYATGQAVAELVAAIWPSHLPLPLLSSFQRPALQGAQAARPEQPRALLLDAWEDDSLTHARTLGCLALVCHYPLWDATRVSAAHQNGLRALSYTVNDPAAARHLIALGTDGIITDEIALFGPASR
ncbi:glycerophosphodiester phosphodiesterase [Allofranklinella schreckenbergeri]|uniref:Glycerophosphodiester phosphodiesterase n=1 Tax=Allofranklinella schreckenbergeri TaxID=1076744 RepID=A0A3M6Q9U2_9BURK|nr:glycerophosphodiester phosphodiesterase [Allofranklinella schreckenbergeri]RMW99943.1 glycerophosphodiester phosphodiesterase [Allofranklinella schreckenbergeri]RRD43732.1 glycerophosphodiester phosphodiesterase [Comamonadaceae bacterium OH3737_COT-264]